MHIRNVVRALALASLLSGAPAALEAQDGWDLPIDRNRMIRAGENKTSSLDSGDRALGDGSYFEAWFFEGRAGQQVTITMRSGAFDTFLAVGRHNGDVIETNDDYEGSSSTNSQISIALPADGMYMIRANSLEAGKTGEYTLTLEGGSAGGPVNIGKGSGGGATMTAAQVFGMPVNRARMLQSAQQASGSLDASDNKLSDDSYFEAYYVELAAGQQVTVTMRSGAFDTYLSIAPQGSSEASESNDDMEEGNTDSRVTLTAAAAGTYVIIANSLEAGMTGDFTIVATVSGGGSMGGIAGDMAGAASKGPAPTSSRVLTLGQTVNSELSADDQKLEDNSFYELWVFQGQAGSRVTITMRSGDFDAYLTIRDTAAEPLGNDDDSAGGTDAQVTVTIPANGRIAIVANSLGEGETGRYTLQIVRAN
jgi:hypothetical protein